MTNTKSELARFIMGMNYGELKAAAAELAGACQGKEARPQMTSAEDFADLLYDWAEANADIA